jgi:hypothetical protein
MKHRLMVERCLPLFITAIFAMVGGWGAPSAHGKDPAASKLDGAGTERPVHVNVGQRDTNVPRPTLSPRASATAVELDTSSLREIERRVLPLPIVEGPNRHGALPDYYWAENRALQDRLEDAKKRFCCAPTPTFRALTLVAGAAGVGKTFIKANVFDKDCPRAATCKFDIRELYDEWANNGTVAEKADLSGGGIVIGRLKSVTDKSKPRLRDYLEAQDAGFYVIDSLDEIHPDDYTWILEQVQEFVCHGERPFVHVVVFGRGFAFHEFWNKRSQRRRGTDVELYLLNPPAFRTTGDLTVSSWNYHSWKYRLAWVPGGNETSKMPLDAYARWIKSGCSRDGEFRSVTCEDNDDMRADVQSAFVDCASKSCVVCSALYNLAGNSMIREILRRETLEQHSYDERRVAEAYLSAWLARETNVHDRPSMERPEHLDLYVSLLRRVAVKYLQDRQIDDRGYFPVRDGDAVTVEYEGRPYTFPVKRILDRSGLIVTDPRGEGIAKYRFEPFWVHRLLVEMHRERMAREQRFALGVGAE